MSFLVYRSAIVQLLYCASLMDLVLFQYRNSLKTQIVWQHRSQEKTKQLCTFHFELIFRAFEERKKDSSSTLMRLGHSCRGNMQEACLIRRMYTKQYTVIYSYSTVTFIIKHNRECRKILRRKKSSPTVRQLAVRGRGRSGKRSCFSLYCSGKWENTKH